MINERMARSNFLLSVAEIDRKSRLRGCMPTTIEAQIN
jgi:hypothetical protein